MNMQEKKLKYKRKNLVLKIQTYPDNKRLCLKAYLDNGKHYADITMDAPTIENINLYELLIHMDCSYDLIWHLRNENIVSKIILPLFICNYEIIRFDRDKLNEYDPKGLENYENNMELNIEKTKDKGER